MLGRFYVTPMFAVAGKDDVLRFRLRTHVAKFYIRSAGVRCCRGLGRLPIAARRRRALTSMRSHTHPPVGSAINMQYAE